MKISFTIVAFSFALFSFSQTNSSTETLFASAGSINENYLKPVLRTKEKNPPTIDMASFNAIFTNKHVNITWATTIEKDNDYFTVERSKDGVNFETASMIKSYGNDSGIKEYFEIDYNPYDGISYYRLKQTNKAGVISYSSVIPVNYHFSENGGISIYPNPTDGNFNINFDINSQEEVLVVIRDLKGNEFYSKVFLKMENNEIIAIDTDSKLEVGTYIVIASSENKIYSHKLVVK